MHARMSTLAPKDTKDDSKQSSCLKTERMRRIEQYKTMWRGQETTTVKNSEKKKDCIISDELEKKEKRKSGFKV